MTSSNTGLAKYLSTHTSFQDPRSSSSPLPALYSDLSRQRKSNPAGYRASVEWWKGILLDVTFAGVQFDRDPPSSTSISASGMGEVVDRTTFRLDESTKARWTIPGVGRPLGLGTVIADLERERTVIPLSSYLKSPTPLSGPSPSSGLRSYIPTTRGVASALLLTPAKWAASSLYTLALGSKEDDAEYSEDERLFRLKRGEWVFFPLVERLSTSFLMHFYANEASLSPLSLLMTTSEFHTKLAAQCGFEPSERDALLVLKYLSRDRREGPAAVVQDGLIKFAPTEYDPVEPITSEDRDILAVHSTLLRLDTQISSLETQITTRNESIKTALRANNPSLAKTHLRSRKALEEALQKRRGVRETLSGVLANIEQAKGDVEVMRALKASEGVLRGVLGRKELQVENVESVMDGLQELVGVQDEVDGVIRDGARVHVDEEEMEEELRVLEAEKRREEGEKTERREGEEREKREREREEAKKVQESKEAEDKKQEEELKARFERLRVAQGPISTPGETASQTHAKEPSLSKEAITE
ncbi:Snf7 [Kalmanozyma brasiliensis GHG001]|uniref:Vacuolar-sorting protein SNF7 n=1 Tax=Kalmanozyma brasiliensis (strain GHG001) TaxID=1365824 RepID=V5ES51_KALBG|nr:Snf7 [Kalmanozyma brasiliensis GHG001]EST04704.1 Snf7 [Kalmanozyma brasiliensis GHG001]